MRVPKHIKHRLGTYGLKMSLPVSISEIDREKIFKKTWEIIIINIVSMMLVHPWC